MFNDARGIAQHGPVEPFRLEMPAAPLTPVAYLTGPHFGDVTDWRPRVADALNARGIDSFVPQQAEGSQNDADWGAFKDLKRCAVLLVNLLGVKTLSLDTIKAVAWAFAMQKPAVVVIEQQGNPHDLHPLLMAAVPFRVGSLDEAVESVAIILNR